MGSVHAEFVKAIVTYSNTGDRPHDKFFNHATKDPKFAQEHPKFAGFMTTAHRVGELPLGHFWEKMEHNFLSHPIRFEANHCGYIVEAIKKDLALPTITEYNDIPLTCVVPPCEGDVTCNSIPEPTSIMSVCIGIIFAAVLTSTRRYLTISS